MRKTSTALLEQGTQTPSPAPDLIPAETKKTTEDSRWDWYSKWGHFTINRCRLSGWRIWLARRRRASKVWASLGNSGGPVRGG
jgi:hypothetical protein